MALNKKANRQTLQRQYINRGFDLSVDVVAYNVVLKGSYVHVGVQWRYLLLFKVSFLSVKAGNSIRQYSARIKTQDAAIKSFVSRATAYLTSLLIMVQRIRNNKSKV